MIRKTSKFKELYTKLMNDVSEYKEDICTFFIQVGKKCFSAPKRIIFVGKATNGWVTYDRNVDNLFDKNNPNRIVNRDDQLEWVHNLAGENEIYNTNKSAFWRVIKNITLDFFGKKDWYDYIAWSNLYKIAPWEGGNPNDYLKQLQRESCISILNEENKILKPDVIVFLTSSWEYFYIESIGLNYGKNQKISWGGELFINLSTE